MAEVSSGASGGGPGTEARVGRVIALMNQKGGVGKTTTAVSLAAAMAQAGRRVCLIDLDPQAHVSLHLGVEVAAGQPTVYDVLIDPQCTVEQALRREVRPNLDFLPAEVDLAAAESELAAVPDRQRILARRFAPLIDQYDFMVLDCPPSLGLLTINGLALAREVLVPMQAHFLALQGVGKLLETVSLVVQSVNASLRVTGVILCMHESQTMLAREVAADLESFLAQAADQNVPWRGCRVLRPFIRRNIKLAEAPSFGKTIFEYAPHSAGATDYLELADQVMSLRDDAAARDATPQRPPALVETVRRTADAVTGAPVAAIPIGGAAELTAKTSGSESRAAG